VNKEDGCITNVIKDLKELKRKFHLESTYGILHTFIYHDEKEL
jgi:hypothetical protein